MTAAVPKNCRKKDLLVFTTWCTFAGMKTTYVCAVCGHAWEPRKPEKPKRCAGCKSPYWEAGDPNSDVIRAKWLMDGAETLSEAADLLVEEAKRIRKLEREGWQLTQEVADDYGFIEKEKSK